MLVAVVLMVGAPDHWDVPLPLADGHGYEAAADQRGSEAAHGRHCHSDVVNCTDIPLVAATGIAFLAAWLTFGVPGGRWSRIERAARTLAGRMLAVEAPPPRLALA